MSNRLEQEFPELTWLAMPPLGPGGVSPQVIRASVERGRALRSRAIRNSARSTGTVLVRQLRAAVALVRCAVRGLAKRPSPERDCWPARRPALHHRWL
jgi:hypothetical protein